jgi:ribosomal protein S15P/S13E
MPKKSTDKIEETTEKKENSIIEESKKEEVLVKKSPKDEKKSKKLTQKEYEKKVLELSKKGLTSEKIGEELRKQGIHTKDYEKKVSKILKENDSYEEPELKNIQNKLEKIEAHVKKNKQDKRAIREKSRIFSQRRKIKKYLKMPLK